MGSNPIVRSKFRLVETCRYIDPGQSTKYSALGLAISRGQEVEYAFKVLECFQQITSIHEKDGVVGSNPTLPTICGEIAQLGRARKEQYTLFN